MDSQSQDAQRAAETGRPISLDRTPELRARLVVQCAIDILGKARRHVEGDIYLPLSVDQFLVELRRRFGAMHPDMVYRTNATIERARLGRKPGSTLPRVVLRQGAPLRGPLPAKTVARMSRCD